MNNSCSAALQHRQLLSVGGYSAVPSDDMHPRLQQAAAFAVSQALELQKYNFMGASTSDMSSSSPNNFIICKAYQQVVAGMNLRMVIMMQDDEENCIGAFAVTVYDRFGDLSVTDWSPEPISCEMAQMMRSGEYASSGALESFFDQN